MPRILNETWVQIGYDIVTEHVPLADENGQVIHDGSGLPKTVEQTVLVLIRNSPGEQHILRIPFDPAAKQELVRKLTGGIIVANGGPVV